MDSWIGSLLIRQLLIFINNILCLYIILMSKAVWGPATWKLLHCMVLKVKTIEPHQLIELKNAIMRIVSNLPCPYCTAHALANIASSKGLA
jgi:hypothetical protein